MIFLKRFPYEGYLKKPKYTIPEIKNFLDTHESAFDRMAEEHLRKINVFNELR